MRLPTILARSMRLPADRNGCLGKKDSAAMKIGCADDEEDVDSGESVFRAKIKSPAVRRGHELSVFGEG